MKNVFDCYRLLHLFFLFLFTPSDAILLLLNLFSMSDNNFICLNVRMDLAIFVIVFPLGVLKEYIVIFINNYFMTCYSSMSSFFESIKLFVDLYLFTFYNFIFNYILQIVLFTVYFNLLTSLLLIYIVNVRSFIILVIKYLFILISND